MKKHFNHFSLYSANGFVYALTAIYFSFIQIYVTKYHTADVAGLLLAIGPFISIFAPVLWGYIADRSKSKNAVLAAIIICSAVCYMALMFNQSFAYLAVMLALTMLFMSPLASITDIITLEYSDESGLKYGPVRIMGTLFYGLAPMVLTLFTDGGLDVTFYAYGIIALISAVFVMTSPKVSGHSSKTQKTSLAPILRDSAFMMIILVIGVSQFAWAYYGNFFPGYLKDLGYSDAVWGVNVFLTVVGEIPFFFAFNKVFDKYGIKKLLIFSLILSLIRLAAMAVFTGSYILLAVSAATGFAAAVLVYCASVYVNKHIAPENKASANSLMYGLGMGIPKVLAGVLGGTMTLHLGYPVSIFICAVLLAVVFAVFLFTAKRFARLK